MPTSTRFLSFAPLVFLAFAAVVACSDGPTFLVGPAASDAGTTVDGGTTADTGAPDDAGPQDAAPQDAGPDPNDPKAVCAAVAGTIPAGATAVPEVYGPTMVGCPGKIGYDPGVVATACGTGWTACSAEQVKARRGSQILAPQYHYWLAPRLWASLFGDTGRCYAAPATGIPGPSNCGHNATGSMHFCSKAKLTAKDRYDITDELGNKCHQVNCDFDPAKFTSSTFLDNNVTTSGDFGGCANGETAGVLCCKN